MSNVRNQQNVQPAIRFKGFTDAWEQRKFSNLVKKVGKHPSVPGDYTAYSVSNVDGLIPQTQQFDGSRLDVLDKSAYKVVNPGEFAYNPARINVGSVAYNDLEFPVLVSSLYVVVRMDQAIDDEFILQFIRSPQFLKEVRRNTEGSVREYLFFDNFKNVRFPFALNIEEQQKVGSFLRTMDDTIALHQREVENLQQLKKSFLQQMFVSGKDSVPRIRFSGFTDAWEQRKLSDLTESHNSGVYIPKDQYGEGTNIIGVGDIYDSDVVDGQRYRLAPVKDERFILHTNDLLYGESSLVPEGIARVVSVSEAGAGTAFAWHTRRFKVNQVTLNSRFLGLELDYWLPARSHLMRSSTKTALTGITTQDFFNTQIVFPSKPEQEKIATLINSLDTTIALHQRKVENLQKLKKSLLRLMFV